MGQAGEELMAPLDFKHFTSVDYKPGEDDAIKYYAQKRKKQYHGNESVQSADKKPEKYIKPDGKVGIRMVKTDKEIINKESIDNHPKVKAARKAHAAGEWDGNVDKEGEAVVHINGKPHTVTNKYSKKKTNEIAPVIGAIARTAVRTAVVNKLTNKQKTNDVDEALNLQQRMKRSRLMKRMKSRIAVGRKRAMKKMANKKTIEKRALRQARNQIAKKLTRGIPKGELTFARKQEIEKRLAKPALQQRIKRIAKKLFKDVRKKELQRKKG
jgi:hypothetical protein